LKQSKTKDQTERDAKIKGYNYNFSRGLDYKIVKNIQGSNQKYHFEIEKRRHFIQNYAHCLWSSSKEKKRLAIKRQGRFFCRDSGAASGEHVSRWPLPTYHYFSNNILGKSMHSLAIKPEKGRDRKGWKTRQKGRDWRQKGKERKTERTGGAEKER